MIFTTEEIAKLNKRYPKSLSYLVDKNGVVGSTNQGFGYYLISKNDKGQITESWSTPDGVDPDDGSFSGYIKGSNTYESVDDLLMYKKLI
jgi:hypothetical protein